MRLSKALEDKMLDKRLRDKLVAEGKLSAAEVEKFLNSLPDDGANMTTTEEVEGNSSSESVTVE
ncbi:hypothetical protein BIY24_06100 [Halobacteriovorax marinus]|uniref:Uncharacterized protein n=1 Tax=Halobacteriovorax marinus (strain ATCC BAA-682 / DSM 15412 / SJ) TaxID=862908 RepID=E1WZ61_HALMS|nr:hypothetical protein [Halobacteriovorax marinus]ATH07529.1 hypothetical protein BIY24_06100 [Halobacteriovorax marinus]CBW26158.1 hypothetical protein BMS_1285 [Halobacteriovorax marinus SJ]